MSDSVGKDTLMTQHNGRAGPTGGFPLSYSGCLAGPPILARSRVAAHFTHLKLNSDNGSANNQRVNLRFFLQRILNLVFFIGAIMMGNKSKF